MNRSQHMDWCKSRALEELTYSGGQSAIASMLSDLTKHPETAQSAGIGAMLAMTVDPSDAESVRRFVVGFN